MAEVVADSELKIFQDRTRLMPGLYASTCPRTRTIVSCNESLAKTLEYGSTQELIGRPINDIYDWDCHSLFDHYYKLWLRSGEFEGLGLSLKTQSGKKLPIYVQVQSIRDEFHKIRYSKVNYRPLNCLKIASNQTHLNHEESLSGSIDIPRVQTFHSELNQVLGLCSIQTEILKSALSIDPFDLESAFNMAQKFNRTTLQLKPLIQAQDSQKQVRPATRKEPKE